jgi:hypothetical protein
MFADPPCRYSSPYQIIINDRGIYCLNLHDKIAYKDSIYLQNVIQLWDNNVA